MLIVSLAVALAIAPDLPTVDSEARRLGVAPLALRRALRETSRRTRASLDDPLYCFVDRLSAPAAPRQVCHTLEQWRNAGFEPVVP